MNTRDHNRRGAALMMVMVILALLLVLAVSFTFLMSQQQGTSVASLGGEQTRIITRTGADHAYARLNTRNRLNEFARWEQTIPSDVTNDNNPWVDGYDESVIDLLADFEGWQDQPPLFPGLVDDNGNPKFRVEDPHSRVLGMNVQDETGKVNLNFSTVALVGNMIGSSTVTSNASSTGGIYEQIVLEDASFLDAYDDVGSDDQHGGGYVVIDNQLFKYQLRRGNVLYNCIPNPPYNSANALFVWNSVGREIQTGEYVTTPTAYKIAYWSWMQSPDGFRPGIFNSVGDVRRIAEPGRWFAPDFAVAPVIMGQRLDGWPEGLDPVTYQWLDENATTICPTEHYDGGWCYPHVVVSGDMVAMGESGKMALQIQYDDQIGVQQDYYQPLDPRRPNPANNVAFWSGLGRGCLVRLRRLDGNKESFLGMVLGSYPGRPGNNNQPSRYGGLTIACLGDRTINQNEAWVIETAERASININTANPDTLAAVFHGVGPRGQSTGNMPISKAQAYEIAGAIYDRTHGDEPFTDLDDLLQFLTELSQQQPAPINAQQVGLFANQQRYPYATRNQGAVTAQFRFDSLDTYMVDAFATRYQPAGGAMARDAFREWVQIGSDNERTYSWFTYEQLRREMELPQGNIMQLQLAGTKNQRAVGLLELPYLHYLADERVVRRWRGLSTLNGPPQPWTTRVPQNMNNLADDKVRPEKFYSNVQQVTPPGSVSSYEAGNVEAGMFSFWYRPQWQDHAQNHYIFDVAEQEYSNRMSLLWWGDRKGAYRLAGKNSGLVFRVKDRTLQEAYTELRYELDPAHFRNGDWYHMALNWKGDELSHISLLLDGDANSTAGGTSIQPVVNHTFRQTNGAWLTRTTTLQQDLENPAIGGAVTIDLPVDQQDVDGYPPRGVVVIGSEAIEYNGNNGYALLNIRRGARGTAPAFHPQGSQVTVFGYTDGLRAYNSNSNNVDVPQFPDLPQTQGLLNSNLGARSFYRVSKAGSNDSKYFRSTELGPDAGFAGAGDDTRGGDPNHLPLDDYTGIPERGIVAVIGLAWNDYMPKGSTPGIPLTFEYPNWNDDGNSNTPPTGTGVYPVPHNVRDPMVVQPPNLNANPQQLRLANLKMEYVAYDGVSASGLNVIARYDQNFNYKPANTWWHFLGTYTDLMVPAAGNQVDANIINFLALGSVVMPLSIDVDSVLGYHDRSIVQVDDEWFFYNRVWNPDNGISVPGATATGNDDNLFPGLFYLDFSRLTIFARHCILNDNKNAVPFSPWRGAMGTGVAGHIAAARVLPTFGTTVKTGETDIITLVQDENSNKEQHQIRRHKPLTDMQVDWVTFNATFSTGGVLPSPSAGNQNQFICGLDDHTRLTFPPNNANQWNRNTNLCKFPTGELPVQMPTQWSFAAPDPRTQDGGSSGAALVNTGDFDAFEFRKYTKGNFRLVSDMTDAIPGNAQDVQVNTPLPPNMGVVHVDNELIAYRGTEVRQILVTNPVTGQTSTIDTYWLVDISRGILGSPVEAHAGGTPIMNMASLRVGRPNASGTPRTSFIATTLGEETFRPYGFIRIEEESGQTEIIGYQRYQEVQLPDPSNQGATIRTGNINCGVYNNPDDPQALFRGSYGTQAMGYSTRALFFDQPVRFPDWFPDYHSTNARGGGTTSSAYHNSAAEGIPGAESPEISYFQGSAAFRNSIYSKFRWRIQYAPLADMSRHSNAIGARLVVRFKLPGRRMPDWGSVPTNRIGGLYSFEFAPGAANTEDLGSTLYEQTQDFTNLPDSPDGIRADRIEWRVYFYFKRGAFADENYKTTLQFQGASMDLNQLTRVVRHEEKR